MQFSSDAATVDLTRTCVQLHDDVTFTPHLYGADTYYHVDQASQSQYFRIGYAEYVFVSLLDGRTTFSQALAITARTCGVDALGQQQALALYSWLLEHKLARIVDEAARGHEATEQPQAVAVLQKLNPFWIRIPFGQPDALLRAVGPALQWLFSPLATLAAVGLMIAAGFQLAADWRTFCAASQSVFAPDNWLWLLVAWLGLKTLHELAHGLVCQRYGGRVAETGVIFAFFAPLAYVDVTSCWSFPSRWKRIHVAAAGMYVELLLAAVAVFFWTRVDSAVLSHLLYNVILMASVSTLLFNANPLMKFDGYYILSDLWQQPNLYSSAAEAVQELAGRWIWGQSSSAPQTRGRHRGLLIIYGLSALAWRMLICVSMLIAASVLFHGAGVALVLAGTLAWFGLPLLKFGQLLLRLARQQPSRLLRGTAVGGGLAAAGGFVLLGLPTPFLTAAPGIVELQEGRQVRSEVDGFIVAVHVASGERVAAGDLLLELENEEIRNQVRDLELQISQEKVRQQAAMQELRSGDAVVAAGNLRSLRQRLRQARQRRDALTITAPTGGVVLARQLSDLAGTFVEEGDELLIVDDQQSRRLRISLAESDVQRAGVLVDQQVPVRIGTRPPMLGVIERMIPRASRRLPARALAASAGGALAVRAKGASGEETHDDLELTEHRFVAVVRLPNSEELPVGERGYATLGRREESLGQHLYRAGREWLEDQVQLARDTATAAQRG